MRKIWDIPGGVHPPENKHQSNTTAIERVALPAELIVPLNQHIGAPARPIVEPGQKVLKGEKIGEAMGMVSSAIHAPSSGTVTAIEERPMTHPSGMTTTSIVIATDGKERWTELSSCENYLEQEPASLVEKIRDSGIAGMGGAGFPSSVKLQPRAEHSITTLILNGTECEPYITADDVLMREQAEEIILGAELLAYILGKPEVIIGVEDNKPEAAASLKKAAQGTQVEIAVFPTKYPSGGEKQLIQILTGKEVPSGKLPAELGIVVQNVGTARAAYRAVRFGEPLIERVTTVVGESLEKQGNVYALIGTPVQHLLEAFGLQEPLNSRVVIGGPMMGFTIKNPYSPVIKTTNCVLAPTAKELPAPPPPSPCIRCGMCSEACPASLLPQQLFWFSQSENFEALENHNLFDCIECGACSYVCPSNLPLVQYYRASKGTIKQSAIEKEKSERSRERFEFRKERLARAEAEKEAKRQARKLAAEKAKQALKDKENNKVGEAATAKPAAKAAPAAPPLDLEKLERAVSSAELRFNNAKQKLQEAKDAGEADTRLDVLTAKVKQAELKFNEAKERQKTAQQGAKTAAPEATTKTEQNPLEKLERALESTRKRLKTAEEKLAEAKEQQRSNKSYRMPNPL